MAVSENDLIVGPLVPAAGVTTISLDFYFEKEEWLEVYRSGSETPLVLDTDYTVAGEGTSSGVVTLTVPANGTDAYSIYLVVPLQRSSDMQLRGEFKSEPFNLEMDRLWQALQGVRARTLRSPALLRSTTAATPTIPAPETGKVLVWGEDGNFVNATHDPGDIAVDVLAAQTARTGAETAEAGAVVARTGAETAEAGAVVARTGAETAEAGAVVARTGAETAEAGAVVARTGAETAEAGAEAARDAAIAGAVGVFADTTAGLAGTVDGDYFWVVVGDATDAYELYLNVTGSAALQTSVPSTDFVRSLLGPGKNLFDKATMARAGFYYSPSSGAIIGSSAYRCTTFIPVEEGAKYTISGIEPGMLAIFADAESDTANFTGSVTLFGGTGTVTVPAGYPYLVLNITNDGQAVTTYDDTLQVEKGIVASAYEAYRLVIADDRLPSFGKFVGRDEILTLLSKNLIDTDKIDYVKRYSTGGLGFTTDTLGIAASDWIEVEEGQFYVLSGDGAYTGWQGGYFTEYGAVSAHSNITFGSPPSGPGRVFQVPTGQGITHVVVSLRKLADDPAATSLHGTVQLEKGEVATTYEAYDPVEYIRPALIPAGSGGAGGVVSATFDADAWYKFVEADEGAPLIDTIPEFRRKWLAREADLCVVNTGTSLTARSTEHCTDHPLAAYRPPLMHSNNFASIIWDRLAWDGQQYRRYDAAGVFTETGTFATTHNEAEWDDALYRHGLTRHSTDAGAAVAFTVPVDAWQFNFIYRADSVGCTAQVTVAEGNGQMEVWNGTAWVEANGHSFSMAEAAPVARNVQVPSPSTMLFSTYSIASKGNTTYQKRLKMRCKSGAIDSRAATKAVTISRTGGGARFSYWGVEWSPREFMVTYINAARGSHNTQATGATGLPRFQDNEVWDFEPDLLLFELPIHNDGAAAAGVYAADYWKNLTENFVFRSDYELSLKTRGAYFGLTPEIAMFTASIAWNFGGIEDDGSLKYSTQGGGKVMSALDKYQEAYLYVKDNYPDAICINAARRWVDAGLAIHGDLKTATLGSGKDGATLTNEGSHWNDTGSKIMAKAVLPLLNFTL